VLGELSRTAPKKEGGKGSSLLLHQRSQELVAFPRPLGGSACSATAVPGINKGFCSVHAVDARTVPRHSSRAGVFLRWLPERRDNFSLVSLNDVDDFLASKASDGWCSTTLAAQGQALRAFFSHAGIRGWCAPGISRGIRSPSIPKYDGLRKGPTWKEVRRLLQSTSGAKPATLRARAVLSLCSIYALRSSEGGAASPERFRLARRNICCTTIEARWASTLSNPVRSGRNNPTISEEREAALLVPSCLCYIAPAVSAPAIGFPVANRKPRIKQLGISSRHKGPHALRHACATHLLGRGTSLKEIADSLGHRDSRSIGIYAKYDTRSQRKVAAFRLAGLR